MAAGAGHRRKIAGEYGVCRKCQRGICVTCPSVWTNPWKRSSLRTQGPAAGTGPEAALRGGVDTEGPLAVAGLIVAGALRNLSFPQ